MGRSYSHQGSQDPRTEKRDCCGCKSWSWLLYLVRFYAEIRHSLDGLRSDLGDVSDSLNLTIDGLRLVQTDSEKLRTYAVAEIETITSDIKSLKKIGPLHHKRPPLNGGEVKDVESEEMALIRDMRNVHGKLIDELIRKVLGYDSVNTATLELVNRLQKSFSLLEDEAKKNREEIKTMKDAHKSTNSDTVSQRDDFSAFNVTLFEVRSVVDRISAGLDVEKARAKTVEAQVSSLRDMLDGIERDRELRVEVENNQVERLEQRLHDLERIEMDIKSDIRRLNFSVASGDATSPERHLDNPGDQDRRAELESYGSEIWRNLNDTLTVHQSQESSLVGDLLNSFENRMLDTQSIEVHTIKERLDKLDNSVKYFAQNLMKLRTLPNDLKILENKMSTILAAEE